jgi:hypothetical protein
MVGSLVRHDHQRFGGAGRLLKAAPHTAVARRRRAACGRLSSALLLITSHMRCIGKSYALYRECAGQIALEKGRKA